MIDLVEGLSDRALEALGGLEARSVAADGGRLKLEWGVLRSRAGEAVHDLLWWDGDHLVGFCGIYAFGPPTVELAGMVDPNHRRRGVGAALLDAALPLCAERGYLRALLVTPRTSTAGRSFAIGRGAALDHSEHALVLTGEPVAGPSDPAITFRDASLEDLPAVARLLTSAFGDEPDGLVERLAREAEPTLLVEMDGRPVGTVRLSLDGDTGGVYGFAVDPELQGRGIGRDVLRRFCLRLRERGATRVHLEVFVDNDRALGLYTSLGFTRISTEDYYALPLT